MAVLMADRVDRPATLFDFLDGPSAAPAPERTPAPTDAPGAMPGREADDADAGIAAGGAAREHDGVGGESTLDDLVVGAWEGLTAQAAVACPLCDGTLRPLYGGEGGAEPVAAGRCDSCGTTLS